MTATASDLRNEAGEYKRDFYAWANRQAALLRDGRVAEADLENIAEEIASMGRAEKRELVSRLAVLLLHLLKWRFQPARRSNSWRSSIAEQRIRLAGHLEDNPSLRPLLPEVLPRAFALAVLGASRQTGLAEQDLPQDCPWSAEQAMADGFLPE
ncbi:MAG: DUF29 domain-containing protein [Acidisphaera sp.]|nr:DUF29 domain-containing protein [Acidisphaera sp.]